MPLVPHSLRFTAGVVRNSRHMDLLHTKQPCWSSEMESSAGIAQKASFPCATPLQLRARRSRELSVQTPAFTSWFHSPHSDWQMTPSKGVPTTSNTPNNLSGYAPFRQDASFHGDQNLILGVGSMHAPLESDGAPCFPADLGSRSVTLVSCWDAASACAITPCTEAMPEVLSFGRTFCEPSLDSHFAHGHSSHPAPVTSQLVNHVYASTHQPQGLITV